jgi:hypothetical protein
MIIGLQKNDERISFAEDLSIEYFSQTVKSSWQQKSIDF